MQGSMLYRPVCTFFVTSIHIPNVNYADSFMNFTYSKCAYGFHTNQ